MRKASIIFFILVFGFSGKLYSQLKLNVKVSASNLFRYGNGKEITVTTRGTKEYFEELGDVRLFVNDFLFGVRYEYDDPIEFGTSVKGISRRFVEFKKEDFTVRAGNFYELFEKGLTLNAFENRGLGFNTQLDGIRINYKKSWNKFKLNATLLGGGLFYNDFLIPGRVENYSIRAGNFNFSPIKYFLAGGSYLYTKGNIPSGNFSTDITVEVFEGNFGFNYKFVNLFFSYANKKTITVPNELYPQPLTPRGDGAYGSLSFTKPGFGATFEYKNYRFNLVVPNERSSTNPTKALPFQNAPTCVKEHSSLLLTRYPHIVDFNDEVGFQFDAFYSPKDNLTINVNASLSSKHYDYLDTDTTVLTKYQRVERNSFIPSLEDALSPFWEFYIEGEYYYKKNLKFRLGAGYQTKILYNIVVPESSDKLRSFAVPLEVKYDFLKKYSVKFISETQRVHNSVRISQKNFYNQYFALTVSKSPFVALTGNLEVSNDEEDPSGKKLWASGEVNLKIGSSNSILLSYGSERGGLKCSSGICRYVNPFNGFRLTLINNFN